MLVVLLVLMIPPALILALAIWLWRRAGRPRLADPDAPVSAERDIAAGQLWSHPGPL